MINKLNEILEKGEGQFDYYWDENNCIINIDDVSEYQEDYETELLDFLKTNCKDWGQDYYFWYDFQEFTVEVGYYSMND